MKLCPSDACVLEPSENRFSALSETLERVGQVYGSGKRSVGKRKIEGESKRAIHFDVTAPSHQFSFSALSVPHGPKHRQAAGRADIRIDQAGYVEVHGEPHRVLIIGDLCEAPDQIIAASIVFSFEVRRVCSDRRMQLLGYLSRHEKPFQVDGGSSPRVVDALPRGSCKQPVRRIKALVEAVARRCKSLGCLPAKGSRYVSGENDVLNLLTCVRVDATVQGSYRAAEKLRRELAELFNRLAARMERIVGRGKGGFDGIRHPLALADLLTPFQRLA